VYREFLQVVYSQSTLTFSSCKYCIDQQLRINHLTGELPSVAEYDSFHILMQLKKQLMVDHFLIILQGAS
jgi:hypothetical protein